jgi:hypothetical protein
MKEVEEFHRVLATAVARPPGAWEYVTLEVERATMRWATPALEAEEVLGEMVDLPCELRIPLAYPRPLGPEPLHVLACTEV